MLGKSGRFCVWGRKTGCWEVLSLLLTLAPGWFTVRAKTETLGNTQRKHINMQSNIV